MRSKRPQGLNCCQPLCYRLGDTGSAIALWQHWFACWEQRPSVRNSYAIRACIAWRHGAKIWSETAPTSRGTRRNDVSLERWRSRVHPQRISRHNGRRLSSRSRRPLHLSDERCMERDQFFVVRHEGEWKIKYQINTVILTQLNVKL
jgi:hypothetical protein